MGNIFKKIKAEWGRIEKKTKAEVKRIPGNIAKYQMPLKMATMFTGFLPIGPLVPSLLGATSQLAGGAGGNVLIIDPEVNWGGTEMGQGTLGHGPFGLPVGGLPDPGVYTPPTTPEINPIMIGFAALLVLMLFGEGK